MKHVLKGFIASAAMAAILAGGQAAAEEPVRGGTLVTVLGTSCSPRRCAMTRTGRRSPISPKAGKSAKTGSR